ncbi:MAG: MFS transporter [Candidatus Eisenbacteria bacterium]|nr:MFS transporter [Candidatus Eisenbacteria bacterium]
MRPPATFVALQHRNFRLLSAGQIISITGSMMQNAAILWHVALLAPPDRKGLALGLVGLVRILPILLFSAVGGVMADARDRRRPLLVTQSCLTLVAATLAWTAWTGHARLWTVYVLAALGSAAGAFDGPARQSLLPNLVPREHLPNAIGLMTILFQVGAVAGPSLGGIVIAASGVAAAYLVNAVSFLAVILALLLMRGVPRRAEGSTGEVTLHAALEGFRFVFRTPTIRGSMLLDFFATFFSSATALLPIFAQDILRVGPLAYGWLYASTSVGALFAGAVMVRAVDRIHRRGRVLFGAVFAYGVATIAFGLSRQFWLTFLCLALVGASDTVSTVLRNVIRQLSTPDSLRGRMTSVNMMFFMGGPQLGEMEAGLIAQGFGAPVSVVSGGLACILATGWLAAKTPELRRYEREETEARC